MKIQGPNPIIQQYRQQQRPSVSKASDKLNDQLNISAEAKHLQQQTTVSAERAAYVKEIKQLVQSGEYKVNHEKSAQKMIDFWTGKV